MKYLLLSLFLTVFSSLFGQTNAESQSPKLVVGIVVDQMRYDYLSKFESKYSTEGFKRLLAGGYSFNQHFLNYVPSNTAPGHATIATGTTPSSHGILNNSWFQKNQNRVVYSTFDGAVSAIGTGSRVDRNSPSRLLQPSFGDSYKEINPKSKTISIALKDRAAVLLGGKKADAAYWFRGKGQGSWISSDYYLPQLPKWVQEFNNSDLINRYMLRWETLYPIEAYTESGPDISSVERGFNGSPRAVFPYDLEKLAPENGAFDLLRATPFGNSFTFDFALTAVEAEDLGTDAVTDFLMISLSSTDYIGHNFGIDSKEIQDTYVRLDRDLGRFLDALDILVGKEHYLLFFTSDHGAQRNPNYRTQDRSNDLRFFKEASFILDVKEFAFDTYGNANVIQRIAGNQVYLDEAVLQSLALDKDEVANAVKEYMRQNNLIGSVRTRSELLSNNYTSGVDALLQNGFNKERSGDILYTLRPGVVVYAKKGSSHGSPFGPDTHVPLVFYGAGIKQGSTSAKTKPTDIAPTVGRLIGLPNQEQWKGNVLERIFK